MQVSLGACRFPARRTVRLYTPVSLVESNRFFLARQGVAVRQSIITLFLARFTLSADEKAAISARDVPVGSRFFAAMDKAEKVRDDCRVLMTGDEGDTKAGIDILSATAAQLEAAYDKLFRHCAFEFRQMGRDASLDVPPTLVEAVRRLRQRPELLTYVSRPPEDNRL